MNQNERLIGHDRDMSLHLLSLCKDLSDEAWDRDFDIGHRTLRETWCHMVLSIDFWIGWMTGQPIEWNPQRWSYAEIAEALGTSQRAFESLAWQIIAENRLDETFVDHWDVRHSLGSTILHVILHNHTHRSDVLHMLQRLGVEDLPEGDPQEWEWRLREQGQLPPA
jgi:uncharacterized damage-inducible protein DinB